VSYTVITQAGGYITEDGPLTEEVVIEADMFTSIMAGNMKVLRVPNGAIYYAMDLTTGRMGTNGVFVPFKTSCKCQG
jgi:hypothetical protein